MPNKIIVLSDTHQNQKFLNSILSNEDGYDYLIHLGDNYEDLDYYLPLAEKVKILRVVGIYHSDYYTGKLPKVISERIGGTEFLLAHVLGDAERELSEKTRVVLFGHTHKPEVYEKNGVIYANPGHLKQAEDRGYEASYLCLRSGDGKLEFVQKNITGKITRRIEFDAHK